MNAKQLAERLNRTVQAVYSAAEKYKIELRKISNHPE